MKFVFSQEESALAEHEKIVRQIATAQDRAVQDAGNLAVSEGRANIASAGFSSRWQTGLVQKFFPNKDTGNPAVLIFHRIGFAGVFEHGASISGSPFLWLPIEQNLPHNVTSPSQYGKKLLSVNVAGKPPLLFDASNRLLGPLFFGTRKVTITKRFDLYRIFAAAAARVQEFLDQRMKG